jgi:hypothetical protein
VSQPQPLAICNNCAHFTGRITGEFGACLIADRDKDSVRAPFDTCKQHELELTDR